MCNSTFYWSNYYDKCIVKGINAAACTDTTQCRNDYGLYCDTSSTNTCICNSTFYWTGTICGNCKYKSRKLFFYHLVFYVFYLI